MKSLNPIIFVFSGLIIISLFFGFIFKITALSLTYSPLIFLLFSIISAFHFLEEDYCKAWKVDDELFANNKLVNMDKRFFAMFSHSIVITNFVCWFILDNGLNWGILYSLGVTLIFGIGNGIAHLVIWLKLKGNTGIISGLGQLLFGLLYWLSFSIRF